MFLLADFALKNMVETTLPNGLETSGEGYIANFGISLEVFDFFAFLIIFSVFQKKWVFGYSWSSLLWYRCYYPHRSRDALSPVCGIFTGATGLLSLIPLIFLDEGHDRLFAKTIKL